MNDVCEKCGGYRRRNQPGGCTCLPDQVRREINGTSYLFTRNRWGWGVVPLDSPTSRFHRSYQIVLAENGSPKSCSCPSCASGGRWCKHLTEADAIRRETDSTYREQLAEAAARCGF